MQLKSLRLGGFLLLLGVVILRHGGGGVVLSGGGGNNIAASARGGCWLLVSAVQKLLTRLWIAVEIIEELLHWWGVTGRGLGGDYDHGRELLGLLDVGGLSEHLNGDVLGLVDVLRLVVGLLLLLIVKGGFVNGLEVVISFLEGGF